MALEQLELDLKLATSQLTLYKRIVKYYAGINHLANHAIDCFIKDVYCTDMTCGSDPCIELHLSAAMEVE
jgi:hypothetical protein